MVALHPAILNLTWDDLREWAAPAIVSRGRSYTRNVEDPRLTDGGGLLGWVLGTERYATRVWVDKGGELLTNCTCPYSWGPCKHAVALILVALERARQNQRLKSAAASDKRWRLLEQAGAKQPDENEEDDWDEEEDVYAEANDAVDEEDEDWEEEPEPRRPRRGAAARLPNKPDKVGRPGKESKDERVLREHFEALSREDLLAFALDRAVQDRKLTRAIIEQEALRGGAVRRIVAQVRREIERLTSQEVWSDEWSGEGSIPDYSHVCQQFENLLTAGQADEVINLAELLWRLSSQQLEEAGDEGETATQIGACLAVARRALPLFSRSRKEQLLWAIDLCLSDDYDVLDDTWDDYPEPVYTRADWAEVAGELRERLNKPSTEEGNFGSRYGRRPLVEWLVLALERAGRKREIIPTLEREAPLTGDYAALIDRLLAARRTEEARRWIVEGFAGIYPEAPAQAWPLEERLRAIEERAGNREAVAALRALEFVDRPALDRYKQLKEASEAAGVWPAARTAALAYLETGTVPGWSGAPVAKGQGRAKADRSAASTAAWPLPTPPLAWAPARNGYHTFPERDVQIEVALFEGRPDEAITLLGQRPKRGGWGDWVDNSLEEKVAAAVAQTHSDFSLNTWRRLAEDQIGRVKPAAYEVAAGHLRRMRQVYERTGRLPEWNALLQDLRQRHKPKRTLMRILDEVAAGRRRIVESR